MSKDFTNIRKGEIRTKLLPKTVPNETRVENSLIGVISQDAPNIWASRNRRRTTDGHFEEHVHLESGLISYSVNGVKKSIVFNSKDCLKPFPKLGDKVQFNINMMKQNNELMAVDVQVLQASQHDVSRYPVRSRLYQGFVATLKDEFGFIETVDHDEVFFHFKNFGGDTKDLELGQEVEYNLLSRNTGSCASAENVKVIPKGTINTPKILEGVLEGSVMKPLRCENQGQKYYQGLIKIKSDVEDEMKVYQFSIMSLVNKREIFQVGDAVTLQIDSTGRAANVLAVRKKLRATVETIKVEFGFLAYEVEEGKKLFFHMSQVKDNANLKVGDEVEFVVVKNQRSGKSSACNVVKIRDVNARPERLISRLRRNSSDESRQRGPRMQVLRQPKGPDGSKGFPLEYRLKRLRSIVTE